MISISLGEEENRPFFQDSTAVGAFAAMQKGIFVSCSAGNSVPLKSTTEDVAPWILTVGGSTIDRKIVATAKLGNQIENEGESLFQPKNFTTGLIPFIYAGSRGNPDSAFCGEGSLKDVDVKEKVVLCDRGGGIGRIDKGVEMLNAGGAAMILMNRDSDGFSTEPDTHVLPATLVSHAA